MARILITGSADGLGLEAARQLIHRGHNVYLHARNEKRALDAKSACPGAAGVLTADLSDLAETRKLCNEANAIGDFDAVILNAGLMQGGFRKNPETGVPALVSVNVIAPYVMSCLLRPPKRLVFISSNLHRYADIKASMDDMFWFKRGEAKYQSYPAYCDSKLHVMLLANAVARRFKNTSVTSVHPGWVATKLGGEGAPDKLEDGVETYVMLAEGDYDEQNLSGGYFEPKRRIGQPIPEARDVNLQERVVKACEEVAGLKLPA
ncbi:hypothetical protein ASPBRDRAFT_48113 [Aspergillus brasiliensis CBS 101740]|uniref:Short chain dehydrogenase n=1 Tax=Aspergillus brasiliensis (strain CBS 101740 / IMI 381727 / IBT 21946) TaxID=767769 RepID=A0A1L9U641_ASPBC|nr:hypothetical protein ASPBRDRAFT_48113 [Aspergillus brasiliensis CBS 101740]